MQADEFLTIVQMAFIATKVPALASLMDEIMDKVNDRSVSPREFMDFMVEADKEVRRVMAEHGIEAPK